MKSFDQFLISENATQFRPGQVVYGKFGGTAVVIATDPKNPTNCVVAYMEENEATFNNIVRAIQSVNWTTVKTHMDPVTGFNEAPSANNQQKAHPLQQQTTGTQQPQQQAAPNPYGR